MEHQAQVQQPGLQLGEVVVRPDGVKEILRNRQLRAWAVEIQTFVVKIVALYGKRVGHNGGHPGDELEGMEQLVLQGGVFRVVVVGIKGQDAPGQLVHNVLAGGLEDHVLGEVVGQGAVLGQNAAKSPQFLPLGQLPEQQQIGRLLKAEAVIGAEAGDDITDFDAPVKELALHGDLLAVLHIVAPDVADLGHSRHHAGAVGVAQTPLDIPFLVIAGVDQVIFREFLT
jgi:hypothetical protein